MARLNAQRHPGKYVEARGVADEQIAWWQANGVGADQAWIALGLPWGWAVRWSEVRLQLLQWLLNADEKQQATLQRLAA